jgi:hypothetical protein
MAKIIGVDGMTADQLNFELQSGAKFVVFQYCVSILVMTFRRSSDVYFVRPGEGSASKGLTYSVLSLLLGWWGIPWGPIWTVSSVVNNFRGGKDVTREVILSFHRARAANPS